MKKLFYILLSLVVFVSCSEYSIEIDLPTPPNNQIWYTSTYGGVLLPNDEAEFGAKILSNTYENGKGIITFGNEVKYIGKLAFEGSDALKQIAIPNSVTNIGHSAFSGCSNLASIIIPDGVNLIMESVFYGCRSLTNAVVGSGVTWIGDSLFENCIFLKAITSSL